MKHAGPGWGIFRSRWSEAQDRCRAADHVVHDVLLLLELGGRFARAGREGYGPLMKLDDLVLELRVNSQAWVRLEDVEGPDRVLEARRLLRAAGQQLGARVTTMNRPDDHAVLGVVDHEVDPEMLKQAADELSF